MFFANRAIHQKMSAAMMLLLIMSAMFITTDVDGKIIRRKCYSSEKECKADKCQGTCQKFRQVKDGGYDYQDPSCEICSKTPRKCWECVILGSKSIQVKSSKVNHKLSRKCYGSQKECKADKCQGTCQKFRQVKDGSYDYQDSSCEIICSHSAWKCWECTIRDVKSIQVKSSQVGHKLSRKCYGSEKECKADKCQGTCQKLRQVKDGGYEYQDPSCDICSDTPWKCWECVILDAKSIQVTSSKVSHKLSRKCYGSQKECKADKCQGTCQKFRQVKEDSYYYQDPSCEIICSHSPRKCWECTIRDVDAESE